MEDKIVLSKATLLYYLSNELGDSNCEITTHLTEDGCWAGHIEIKQVKKDNQDMAYLTNLVESRGYDYSYFETRS